MKGRVLQELVHKQWVIPMSPQERLQNMSIGWYKGPVEDRIPMFVRHAEVNGVRVQLETRKMYKGRILADGIIKEQRGQMIGVVTSLDPQLRIIHLIAGATLSEPFYDAHAEAPDNEQVLATLQGNNSNVLLLMPNTPKEVLDYLMVDQQLGCERECH